MEKVRMGVIGYGCRGRGITKNILFNLDGNPIDNRKRYDDKKYRGYHSFDSPFLICAVFLRGGVCG